MYNSLRKLKNDPLAIIMGIASLVTCCCCGGFGIIFSIIGLITANSGIREFNEDPDSYLPSSYQNMKTARILSIIGIVLNGLLIVWNILSFVFNIGTSTFSTIGNEF